MLYSAKICYTVLRYAVQGYDYMLYKLRYAIQCYDFMLHSAKICYTVLTYAIMC